MLHRPLQTTPDLVGPVHEDDLRFVAGVREHTFAHARTSKIAGHQRKMGGTPREAGTVVLTLKQDALGLVGPLRPDPLETGEGMACSIKNLGKGFFGCWAVRIKKAEFGGVLFNQMIEAAAKATLAHASGPRANPQRDERA